MSYLSNLPCTMEQLEEAHGEGKPSDTYDCSKCGQQDIDPLSWFIRGGAIHTEGHHIVNGQDVCGACVKMCDVCMEYLDDAMADRGPSVLYRDPLYSGRLTHGHAECAADYLAERLELPTKDETALLLAVMSGEGVEL